MCISDKTVEALTSVHLATDMVAKGKHQKAHKLYKHAFALDPTHPDVLNSYGEYLEKFQKDIVKAEHMYCRALTLSPKHSKALVNRQRTLPLVEEIDQITFNRIDQKRDYLIKVPESHPGLRRMKKESYFQHIHHTTAIEGNTFTLAQTRSVVENKLAIGGKSVIEHNEIIGLDAALSYLNNTLVQRVGAISLDDILEIHKRVLGFVDPIEAGKFRTTQVFVGDFVPPEATQLKFLIAEFIEWLNSPEALDLHPIEHAALAHYKLVTIHPFYDGNGRTSRLLMNLILMQAGFPPVIIRKEEKHIYYQTLQTANKGDVRPFIRFIARCTERTVDEFLISSSDQFNFAILGKEEKDEEFRRIILEDGTEVKDDGRTIIVDDDEDDDNETIDGL